MTDQANEQVHIDASPARCFAVATDYERYPEWARDVREVAVHARDALGRATTVEYRVAALGRTIRYVLAYDYAGAPGELSWRLVEGDALRRLDGRYRFEPAADGGTQVTYELAVDLTLPLPGLIRRRAAGLVTGAALTGLKQRVEQPVGT